jgi:CHAD domain-containing protein
MGGVLSIDAAALAREQLGRLLAEEAGVRAGQDPEAVHRMRVATRRLRTALKLFRIDGPADDLRELAAALGRVRDRDVFAAGLRARAAPEELPAVEGLLEERAGCYAEARQALLGALDDATFDGLRSWSPGDAQRAARPRLLVKRLKALRRSRPVTRQEQHRTRIRAKRLRYAGEFLHVAPGLTALAREIQDALGDAQDAENALDVLLDALPRHPELARIAAACRADVLACQERFAVLWRQLPRPRELRKQLEAEAR